jgi:hypothetical protein
MLDVKQQSINGNGNNYRIMHYVFEFSINDAISFQLLIN